MNRTSVMEAICRIVLRAGVHIPGIKHAGPLVRRGRSAISRLTRPAAKAFARNERRGRAMTVLVTGGAGYIGSHTVHALVDAGERVLSCSTICPPALPPRCPSRCCRSSATSATSALVAALIEEHKVDAIIHFAGSIVVPEFDEGSARLLPQQHRQLARADRGRGQGRRAAFHLLLDRRGLRQSGARAGRRGRPDRADVALRLVEADDRGHAARRRRRARAAAT